APIAVSDCPANIIRSLFVLLARKLEKYSRYYLDTFVEHFGRIYTVAKDGSVVSFTLTNPEYEIPDFVVKELLKRAASKSERSVSDERRF
ncbi:MAG: hypothetical protein LBD07_02540, partial [Spirochaetaceae bacterium]|nr:hypothetical protein [Spirochaetaceae bacterium]